MATKTTKTATKAKSKPVAAAAGQYGIERSKDLPWCAKKVAVYTSLIELGADSAAHAVAATSVAATKTCKAADTSPRYVRHYCYHGAVSGHTLVVDAFEGMGYGFAITAAGRKALATYKAGTPSKPAKAASAPAAQPKPKPKPKSKSKSKAKAAPVAAASTESETNAS